ncbi:hypothetical protein [Goodfellowiella coeruleoviolacea]|nr:hypothetical protein [Goodfellowiella coeruleoviolacea]
MSATTLGVATVCRRLASKRLSVSQSLQQTDVIFSSAEQLVD